MPTTSGTPTSSPAPTQSPDYSTSGAFNGTGIALATQSFGQGTFGTVVVYFQHWTGQIRYMQLDSYGSWRGGDESTIVATNARNGTPIAAVAYAMNEISTWHIFYIDKDNTLQEKINGNTTNLWLDGPLGSYGFQAMDDPNVGLQGCWAGYRPGDQINAIPIQGSEDQNYTSSSQTLGISLWYGATPTRLQSVGWTFGTETWGEKERLDGFNGHAGIGCYSWGPGTVTYLMASDLSNTVNIWWKDLNSTGKENSTHPIETWTNSSVAIPNSFQNTSLGYTSHLYSQDSELNLVGYNVSWNAENTAFVPGDEFEIEGDQGLAGTHMSVTAVPSDSGGESLLVFNQIEGDSITVFTRDIEQGQWTSAVLPLPQQ
ncbi:hypothetical protein LTR37_015708 [Vermiconidia calcicola]|uniref:Uncharacterized protein n=1 Tax=Vermiconidia calcicola TaxID=1690605 RepID=A0ACC3MPY7_9PEZI|nr:hypothetical protein LTR37_015708 [Vermiconidia calcicola]